MKKPDGLRRLLLQAVPHLTRSPESLSIFIDKGTIAARTGASLGFVYGYTLNIVVQDYAGTVDDLIVPVLAWIAEAQPDLLAKPDSQPFRFESEILDGDAADVSIYIDLTEAVLVTPKPAGGFDARHLDEPRDDDWFDGVCGASLWQLFLRDQLIAQTTDPAFVP